MSDVTGPVLGLFGPVQTEWPPQYVRDSLDWKDHITIELAGRKDYAEEKEVPHCQFCGRLF